jgi:hypothetical protein
MGSAPTWVALAIAVAVVAAMAIVIGVIWRQLGASEITTVGWLALILGVIVTCALGVGLMALVFISNRRGYDDPERRDR